MRSRARWWYARLRRGGSRAMGLEKAERIERSRDGSSRCSVSARSPVPRCREVRRLGAGRTQIRREIDGPDVERIGNLLQRTIRTAEIVLARVPNVFTAREVWKPCGAGDRDGAG